MSTFNLLLETHSIKLAGAGEANLWHRVSKNHSNSQRRRLLPHQRVDWNGRRHPSIHRRAIGRDGSRRSGRRRRFCRFTTRGNNTTTRFTQNGTSASRRTPCKLVHQETLSGSVARRPRRGFPVRSHQRHDGCSGSPEILGCSSPFDHPAAFGSSKTYRSSSDLSLIMPVVFFNDLVVRFRAVLLLSRRAFGPAFQPEDCGCVRNGIPVSAQGRYC